MKAIRRTIFSARRGFNRVIDRLTGMPPLTKGSLDADAIAALVATDTPVLLEIGCNDGQDTEQFLAAMPGALVHCFEPDERAASRFKERIGDDRRVHLHRTALGAHTGVAQFHVSKGAKPGVEHDWDLSGSIRKPKNHLVQHDWVTFPETRDVPIERLDDWCNANGIDRIDLIWMDVQGAERDVIEGGRGALARTRFLYTEYCNDEMYEGQPTLRELIGLLPEFDVVTRYPNDLLLRNRNL